MTRIVENDHPRVNAISDMDPNPIYLDCNATTPVDPRVVVRMQAVFMKIHGNAASRDHSFGWNAAEAVEEARYHVANLISAHPSEIFFTSGATESSNWAIKGFFAAAHSDSPTIATCATEHAAVLGPCHQLKRWKGICTEFIPVNKSGRINFGATREIHQTIRCGFVSLALANNEIGVIQPVRKIAEIVRQSECTFFSDLAQAAGKVPIDIRELGTDLAALSAHKLCGPKGVGALFIRSGKPEIKLEPLIVGGGQERGLRAGTLNVPGIVGFGEACRIAKLEMEEEAVRVGALRDKLEKSLLSAIPDIWINGDRRNRLSNTSNMGFRGVDARTLIRDMHDIAVSTKSACSSGDVSPSHVLKAIGLTDDEAYSCVRFSLGRFTTEQEIDYTIDKIIASVRKLRRNAAASA